MQLAIQYQFHSWGQPIYPLLLFCQTTCLEACSWIVVELYAWRRCRSSLLAVMDSQKRVGEDKMRLSLSLSLSVCRFDVSFLCTCCVADAPSSKCLPKAHFKFYTNEFGTGFSIPQNVWLLFSNYIVLLMTCRIIFSLFFFSFFFVYLCHHKILATYHY